MNPNAPAARAAAATGAPADDRLDLAQWATRQLFFTGKGGVGKTSLACAVALRLAGLGRRVLLVSLDPASNLDEMLGLPLGSQAVAVPGAERLWAMNIDPEAAAEAYRQRVLARLDAEGEGAQRDTVREQLSGACTTEIAAFDEFVGLLAGDAAGFDHVVFDTAPTGHTLRLLSLPKAWSGFLASHAQAPGCLGPHSGLKMQEARFRAGLAALSDPAQTTLVLVTRADGPSLREAERTHRELLQLGLTRQRLIVNARFVASRPDDPTARALRAQADAALAGCPPGLATLPRHTLPLQAIDMVGLPALRALLEPEGAPAANAAAGLQADALPVAPTGVVPLAGLVDALAEAGHGLVMVMGKGGVGKTTVAAALAVGLAQRGCSVHLSTTDPAAHLAGTLGGEGLPGLKLSRIDPAAETAAYVEKVMASRGAGLDEAGRALLREDLRSPCTEEVAVFHAFARTVAQARSAFVVLDTAPTGHTLLLMDATGAYHRQMARELGGDARFVTPLMRLQDSGYTRVLLVTLPERTPVSEAAALQDDLRRARIEPYAWVVNRSLLATGTRDPLLRARLRGEQQQLQRVRDGLAQRVHLLPWQAEPPLGLAALSALVAAPAAGVAA